jgi:Flp pilus assembly protein TadD
MTKHLIALAAVLTLLAPVLPVSAAPTAAEASGVVVDAEGNPIQGALVVLWAKSNPDIEYPGKTNKKGRYYIPGLFTGQENDRWQLRVEAEGFLPVEMVVESRTVNRVLVGDIETLAIKPNSKIPDVNIRPMGSAQIDFTVAPADEVMAKYQESLQAQAAAEAAASGQPIQPQIAPWDEALSLASAGDLEAAIEIFPKAIKNEPEDAERREVFAKVLYQAEHFDEAEEQARKALELEPDRVSAYMVLYGIYVSSGDLEQAGAALDSARSLAPDDVRVLQQMAYVADEAGDVEGAIAANEGVVAVDPQNTDAWMALGDLYAGTGQMDKSEQAYERVVELAPDNAHQIFYNLAALLTNKPDRTDAEAKKAIDLLRRATELKPDYAQAYKQLAFALLGTGDRAGARDALDQYVKLAPDASDVENMQNLLRTLNK